MSDRFLFKRQCIYSCQKGCKVLNKVCERGTFFAKKKWYIKLGKLLDRRAEPSHIKLCWVPVSPGFSTNQLKNLCSDSKKHSSFFSTYSINTSVDIDVSLSPFLVRYNNFVCIVFNSTVCEQWLLPPNCCAKRIVRTSNLDAMLQPNHLYKLLVGF